MVEMDKEVKFCLFLRACLEFFCLITNILSINFAMLATDVQMISRVAQLKNSITREVSSNEEIVLMYALLIAITLKGDEQSLNFLRHIRENSTVRWFKEITSIFLSTFKSINISEHIIPSQNKRSELIFY